MTAARLGGDGVLVTRPAHLADELADAVAAAGGRVIAFPVIDIVPEDPANVAGALSRLAPADIVIFVSRNAVQHGLDTLDSKAAIAAIGPATRDALRGPAGRHRARRRFRQRGPAGRAGPTLPASAFASFAARAAANCWPRHSLSAVRPSITWTSTGANRIDSAAMNSRRSPGAGRPATCGL